MMRKFTKAMALTLVSTMGLGLAGYTLAEGPQARAIREREERRQAEEKREQERKAAKERAEDKKDHPEIWAAIKSIRAARNAVQESKNEKERFKTPAIKAMDEALASLESLMAR